MMKACAANTYIYIYIYMYLYFFAYIDMIRYMSFRCIVSPPDHTHVPMCAYPLLTALSYLLQVHSSSLSLALSPCLSVLIK